MSLNANRLGKQWQSASTVKHGVFLREAIRGEDLLLLTHSTTNEGIGADRNRAGQAGAALMALVDKVDSEKELDGSRKLVAYATVCLAGDGNSFPTVVPPSSAAAA